jgi:hypothetical protein
MTTPLVMTIGLVVVPILLLNAWRVPPQEIDIPTLRSRIGPVSMLLISASWIVAAACEFPEMVNVHFSWNIQLRWGATYTLPILAVIALVLGLLLRGRRRMLVCAAAIIMLLCWPGGYSSHVTSMNVQAGGPYLTLTTIPKLVWPFGSPWAQGVTPENPRDCKRIAAGPREL